MAWFAVLSIYSNEDRVRRWPGGRESGVKEGAKRGQATALYYGSNLRVVII
jgi:hypothetical protein